jgi:hypothetical protein
MARSNLAAVLAAPRITTLAKATMHCLCRPAPLPVPGSGGGPGTARPRPSAGAMRQGGREGSRADADRFCDGFRQAGRGVVDVAGDGDPGRDPGPRRGSWRGSQTSHFHPSGPGTWGMMNSSLPGCKTWHRGLRLSLRRATRRCRASDPIRRNLRANRSSAKVALSSEDGCHRCALVAVLERRLRRTG